MDGVSEVDTPFLSLFAAFSYGVASMAMVFINKAVLIQYAYSMTLLTLQQLATTLLIHFGRVMGYTKFKDINTATAKKLLPISVFYNANVAFALASLKGVNIPMYIALKRLTPLAVLAAGYFSGKGIPPLQCYEMGPLLSICSSGSTFSCIYCCRLHRRSYWGLLFRPLWILHGPYFCSFPGYPHCSSFATMYLVLVEKSGAEDGLSSVELMFYNSLLSLPFLIFLIIATGEFPQSLSFLVAKANSLAFFVILVLSLVMGIVLNFTMFLCTVVNSALTTTIVGVLKGIGSTTLGFVLLGGIQVHALNVTGLIINTAGGVWYSYAKYQQRKRTPRKIISDEEAYQKKDESHQ